MGNEGLRCVEVVRRQCTCMHRRLANETKKTETKKKDMFQCDICKGKKHISPTKGEKAKESDPKCDHCKGTGECPCDKCKEKHPSWFARNMLLIGIVGLVVTIGAAVAAYFLCCNKRSESDGP